MIKAKDQVFIYVCLCSFFNEALHFCYFLSFWKIKTFVSVCFHAMLGLLHNWLLVRFDWFGRTLDHHLIFSLDKMHSSILPTQRHVPHLPKQHH